ncbi:MULTISPECIES: Sec-independent protein translocase subunit TatA [Streptomyces]|uniref:Sec-independent protein translocase protein TatA n=1 Tax=Streptomyces morookaense TaxID=1970 RepID=A0A7Y7B7G6_STRMO|nr:MULTISPECIES: Sec-independent protein translocase subunit TatA [Streptomyces]MCC2277669.1 Sec-independent protein translocase subunit TatA [Streptomyces sp. ET3-23]NVK80438.1 Sec-independent protein translocase subunit TatA [Streptomyces morookaense]GHF14001.1 Sec-independent protein translocase protein TatA [Streptomyces morookaense]
MLRNALEPWHLLVVVLVVVVLFGSKKLPDTARALGKSMRILKSEAKAMKDEGGTAPANTGAASDTAAAPVSGIVHPSSPNGSTADSAR